MYVVTYNTEISIESCCGRAKRYMFRRNCFLHQLNLLSLWVVHVTRVGQYQRYNCIIVYLLQEIQDIIVNNCTEFGVL